MRILISLAVCLGSITAHIDRASATECTGGNTNRRIVVGDVPDLFFTVGTAATQNVRPLYLNFTSVDGYTDCHVYARSNVPGISIQQTYFTPGVILPPGEWAGIDQDSLPVSPLEYRDGWGYPDSASGYVPIIYDGTSPAAEGTIDIAVDYGGDTAHDFHIIGKINVYIVGGTTPTTWFRASASAGNMSGDTFAIDHPLLNGRPGAKFFITHYGSTTWNHPTAVTYDTAIGKWRIRNEDGTAMPSGLTFNVRIDPRASYYQTNRTVALRYLQINHPDANNNPYATILVTPISKGSRRILQPFTVTYVAPYWQIKNAAGVNWPISDIAGNTVGFFVHVISGSKYADDTLVNDASGILYTSMVNGIGVDINGPSRVSGNRKTLSAFCWLTLAGSPPIVILTSNETPLSTYNSVDPRFLGAYFIGNLLSGYTATAFHEDGTAMPGWAAMNVWSPQQACLGGIGS